MKKLLTYTAIALLSISFLNAQQWFFETMFNSEGWNGIGGGDDATMVNVENGLLTATTNFWEGPRIQNPDLVNISAADHTMLKLSIATDAAAYWINPETGIQASRTIRVFWKRDSDEGYSADRLISHQYLPLEDPTEFQEIEIDLTQHDSWSGSVVALRLDLGYMGGKQVDVDYIILSGEATTSITEQAALNQPFKIFPNPASDVFTINNTSGTDTQVRIFAITGSLMLSRWIGPGESAIDITGLNAGIYMVSIDNKVLKLSIR